MSLSSSNNVFLKKFENKVVLIKTFILLTMTTFFCLLIISGTIILSKTFHDNNFNNVIFASLKNGLYQINNNFIICTFISIFGFVFYLITCSLFFKLKFSFKKAKLASYSIMTSFVILGLTFYLIAIGLTPKFGTSDFNNSIFFSQTSIAYYLEKDTLFKHALFNQNSVGWMFSFFLWFFLALIFAYISVVSLFIFLTLKKIKFFNWLITKHAYFSLDSFKNLYNDKDIDMFNNLLNESEKKIELESKLNNEVNINDENMFTDNKFDDFKNDETNDLHLKNNNLIVDDKIAFEKNMDLMTNENALEINIKNNAMSQNWIDQEIENIESYEEFDLGDTNLELNKPSENETKKTKTKKSKSEPKKTKESSKKSNTTAKNSTKQKKDIEEFDIIKKINENKIRNSSKTSKTKKINLLGDINLKEEYANAVAKDKKLSELYEKEKKKKDVKKGKDSSDSTPKETKSKKIKKESDLEKITQEKLEKVGKMSTEKIKEFRGPAIAKVEVTEEFAKQMNNSANSVVVKETAVKVKKQKKETFIDKEIKERLKKFYE